ncbi:MAG: nucleotide-binding protein [Terracidiphilus sp.]
MQRMMAGSKNLSTREGLIAFTPTISRETVLTRLRRLLDQIPELRSKGRNSPFLTTWQQNIEGTLHAYYGPESLQLAQFRNIEFFPNAFIAGGPETPFIRAFSKGTEIAESYLQSRIAELEEDATNLISLPNDGGTANREITRSVFVVHGHDHGIKETVARFLSKLELDPIILHEKPNEGRTIIEKFEHHANVTFAVVILSPDDMGFAKKAPDTKEQRARQNVIFELGFFVSKLGRSRTLALLLPGVTKPSDFDGVLYIPMNSDSWKMEIVRELKAAGLDVDANKAY